ncbi:response regulator transcription factor [Candidatus Gracilibacteria bacterium]|nr:response regulator transcription factor [Candidatus Gracilibacteria bacterium]
MKVLVVEDNEILSRNIVRYLSSREIFTEASLDGEDGLYKALTKHYDVIILDINLPKKDGLEVCKTIRDRGKEVSIIMLTSRGTNEDIVTGLDIGADDYLVKPFEYSELFARINAIYRRRMQNQSNTMIYFSNIEINLKSHEVKQNGENISLSKLEFELLKFLAQNRSKALSREEIYEVVWGESGNDFVFSKTIDVYVGYLRKKLGKDSIETVKGFGFLIP